MTTQCKHPTESLYFYSKKVRCCEDCNKWWIKDGFKWRDPTADEAEDIMKRGNDIVG